MREILAKRLRRISSADRRKDLTREFLQYLILSSFDRRGLFGSWAFVGGTALRVLYDLRRFSEDLDFSLIHDSPERSLDASLKLICADLEDWGFLTEATEVKRKAAVESAFIRFPKLLKEVGAGSDPRQKLSVKLDVDMNPPRGYNLETSPVHKDMFYLVVHHDLGSLFSGKLHAFLFRGFTKGRDVYDLLWYMTKGVPVNLGLLRNAAIQTQGNDWRSKNQDTIRRALLHKVEALSISKVKDELRPFLEDSHELKMIEKEYLKKALEKLEFSD